jgi:hypothetical protein
MRAMMIIIGGTGLGGTLGCAAASLLPGFELASALIGTLGAMAGTAGGVLACITAPPSWSARDCKPNARPSSLRRQIA